MRIEQVKRVAGCNRMFAYSTSREPGGIGKDGAFAPVAYWQMRPTHNRLNERFDSCPVAPFYAWRLHVRTEPEILTIRGKHDSETNSDSRQP